MVNALVLPHDTKTAQLRKVQLLSDKLETNPQRAGLTVIFFIHEIQSRPCLICAELISYPGRTKLQGVWCKAYGHTKDHLWPGKLLYLSISWKCSAHTAQGYTRAKLSICNIMPSSISNTWQQARLLTAKGNCQIVSLSAQIITQSYQM